MKKKVSPAVFVSAIVVVVSVIVATIFIVINNENSGDKSKTGMPAVRKIQEKTVDSAKIKISNEPQVILPDGDYVLDTHKSIINWYCVIHQGYTLLKKGNLKVENGTITGGDFEILMDSIVDTDIDYYLMKATLENTLKSDMFFDTGKYPVSRFHISNVSPAGSDKFNITGDLTIKNITREVGFVTSVNFANDTLTTLSERFSIDRTKWGITIYSENFPQTDDSFLFTDYIDFVISLAFYKKLSN